MMLNISEMIRDRDTVTMENPNRDLHSNVLFSLSDIE